MQNTLEHYEIQRKQAGQLLAKLINFIKEGTNLGVTFHPSLIEKINAAIASVGTEQMKVALVGGFSEGKTSIAAAWLERLDRSMMNINQQESSSEVQIFDFDNRLKIIDTPGLFGFKEKTNATTQEIEKFKDITKRYVSEAHLVLYVMNSTNPIKESHTEELRWLLRTLNLLPRTVFVLSRFDEVADVDDDVDFAEKLKVKKASVLERLNHILELSAEERSSLSITAVSANPYDMGVDHWLKNIDQFRKISRIGHLQSATSSKIENNGGPLAIVNEARKSVISDVISKQLPIARIAYESLHNEATRISKIRAAQTIALDDISAKIISTQSKLRGRIIRYLQDLQAQLAGVGISTINDFLYREIGNEGIVINQRIQEIFDEEVGIVNQNLFRIQVNIDNEINHFNDVVSSLGKSGIKYLAKPGLITNKTVLLARDGFSSITKALGIDISSYLKFKPWGATKFASGLASAVAVVSVALEVMDAYKERERQLQFEQDLKNMIGNIRQQQSEIVGLIDSPDYASNFFPTYQSLKNQMLEIERSVEEINHKYSQFQQWYQVGEVIDLDYRSIQPTGESHFTPPPPPVVLDTKSVVSVIEDKISSSSEKTKQKNGGLSFIKRLFS